MKMPARTKKMWTDALRSGKYEQSVGTLYCDPNTTNFDLPTVPRTTINDDGTRTYQAVTATRGGYCCLGVLQHCLTGEVERWDDGRAMNFPSPTWLKDNNISDIGGALLDLSNMNDVDGVGFQAIALWIDLNVLTTD